MTAPLRALTLVLAALSSVAALPSPEAAPAADSSSLLQKINLFGFVERKAIPLPPPSSGQDSITADPASEAWDPLNLPAAAAVASSPSPPSAMRQFRTRAAARLVNTERELRWTPAPEEEEGGEGSGEEPGEQMAEGDEEEEELVEDDEEEGEGEDEGDMLGEEGWFRTRRVKRSAHAGGVEKVVRTRRSWKS